MAGPTQLEIYKLADVLLAEARLGTIADDVESRYAMDDAWPRAVDFVLRAAPWRFATAIETLAGASPSGLGGYTYVAPLPATCFRVLAYYVLTNDGVQCPFELREQQSKVYYNVAPPAGVRFISTSYTDPSFDGGWPEHFAQAVAAYLAFLIAYRVTGNPSAPGHMSQLYGQLLEEAKRLDANREDEWLPYQRDGSFLGAARTIIGGANWTFALKTIQVTALSLTAADGWPYHFTLPEDWLRTQALFVTYRGTETPFDIRQTAEQWSTATQNFTARYLSKDALDATLWPEAVSEAVLAYLDWKAEPQGNDKESAAEGQANASDFQRLMVAAMEQHAIADDPWLRFQRDGSFPTAARVIIGGANWTFAKALKTIQVAAQSLDPAADGWPYRFALPDDWLRTQALFVTYGGTETPFDVRQTAEQWSTATEYFTARYLSTDALDATLWPKAVSEAVLAYLDWKAEPQSNDKESAAEGQADAADFQRLMAAAVEQYAIAEDPWLRFQLSGLWRQALGVVAEKGRWRFAIKTIDLTASSDPNAVSDGSVSPGYAFRFLKPNDWQRTIWLYYAITDGLFRQWCDVDFRDELDAFHANYSPIRLRYLTRLVLDATRWPSSFREAVRLYCLYVEASADPKGAARAGALLKEFSIACSEAEAFDDEREVPPVRQMGRFVRGRYASRSFSISSGAATPSISTGTPSDTTPPPATGTDALTLDGETLTLDGETLTLP